LVPTGGK